MSGFEEWALRFTLAAVQVMWIGAFIGLGTFAIERLIVKSAAARHAVHLIGLLTILATLPVALVVGSGETAQPAVSQTYILSPSPTPSSGTARPSAIPIEIRPEAPHLLETTPPSSQDTQPSTTVSVDESAKGWQVMAPWVAGIYAFGLLAMTMRLCLGLVGAVRLRARSEAMTQGEWLASMQRMATAMRLRVRPALHWSREVTSPVVMGLIKPAILLPVALVNRLTPAQVEAVLAHELAHLCRRDTWAVAVQRLAETVLFFHPAVWWMSRRLEIAREQACDDLVVATGCDPADYAEALLVCSEYRLEQATESDAWTPKLASTGRDEAPLRQRVLRLLGQGKRDSIKLGQLGWLMAVLAFGGIIFVATADGWERESLADFDFNDPPMGYEKGVEVADRDQRHQVAGLRFSAASLQWMPADWTGDDSAKSDSREKALFLDLGIAEGFEIVEFRLFDHETRRLVHGSSWQHTSETESKFAIERVGSSSWMRIDETGGTIPRQIDVWLRVVRNGDGDPLIFTPEDGASVKLNDSEIRIESIFRGEMDGDGQGPSEMMRWNPETVRNEDQRFTVNFENRGSLLAGRYHLVAVLTDGTRRVMDDLHFRDFKNHRHPYVSMNAPLEDVTQLELIPFRSRHKFFFNGLTVPRPELPDLGQTTSDQITAWAAAVDRGDLSEEAFVQRLKQAGPQTVRGLITLMRSGKTDRLAMKGIEAFLDDADVVDFLAATLLDLSAQPEHLSRNPQHCCLLLLGESGDPSHVDLAASFLESTPIAAMYALEGIGGTRARDHLIGAFDRIPTDKWWLLAEHLGRMGDPASIPELKRRLAMVETPPSDAFPRRSVGAFTEAIRSLSDIEDSPTWHSWQQGQSFLYPYDGQGSAKTFSLRPLTDNYVKLPKVNPNEPSGRKAIWDALNANTIGAGFTMDGDEVALFHGLRAAPLWENGPPYPTTLHEWLDVTSHADLLESVRQDADSDRIRIPKSGLLVAKDLADRLYILKLEKRSANFDYHVSVRALDPLRQLVKPTAVRPFTPWLTCTLHDLESETTNGALNLNRNHRLTMDATRWRAPSTDAVLVAEFAANRVALGIAGAEAFVLTETPPDVEVSELVRRLTSARTKAETIEGHERLQASGAIFHRFDDLKPEQCFAIAARMPGGSPVAGILHIRQIDHRAKTVDIRYRFLWNAYAQQIFDPKTAMTLAEDADPMAIFQWVERFARLPREEQAAGLADFYRGLPTRAMSPMVEAVLSVIPHHILDPSRDGEPGNTSQWARQLESAASEMGVDDMAARLESPLWLRVAARARALQVLQAHTDAVIELIAEDLDSPDKAAIERATSVIVSLQRRGVSERLLELWLADDERSQAAWGALVFLPDPAIIDHLKQRIANDPAFLKRCSGLFQRPLAGKEADPLLLSLIDSPDADIRYHAANALQECRDSRLGKPVSTMASAEDLRLRTIAANMIAKLPAAAFQQHRAALLGLLEDESDEVKFKALWSIAQQQDLAAGPIILTSLQNEAPNEQCKVWIMQAMSNLSGKTWNYDMHRWGDGHPGNREAIARFEAWLENANSQ